MNIIPHVRLFDSRFDAGGAPIQAGATQTFGPLTGSVVPVGATAVLVNLTTTNSEALGWLEATGGASCHNYGPNEQRNSLAAIKLEKGRFSLKATATTHLIVDVQAYETD